MSLKGQASWAKMTSHGMKLTAPACHLTKYVNKAEQRAFLSTKIGENGQQHFSKNHQQQNLFPQEKVMQSPTLLGGIQTLSFKNETT